MRQLKEASCCLHAAGGSSFCVALRAACMSRPLYVQHTRLAVHPCAVCAGACSKEHKGPTALAPML